MIPSSRCAACKYLRKKCPSDCIFSPYFPSNNPQRFTSVHKIFGASNIGKMLKQLPVDQRSEAADSLHYEAQLRVQDPIYGSVGIISFLQEQIHKTQQQIAEIRAQIALQRGSDHHHHHYFQQLGISNTSFNNESLNYVDQLFINDSSSIQAP